MSNPSYIGSVEKVELPKYGEGLKCSYPAEQAKRGAEGEIKAEKFREKDAMARDKVDGY